MKKRALISVSDKSGLVEFSKELVDLGYEIISTGGTAKVLLENGLDVISISDLTKFPECLDGRLKTLHPAVHGGVLAVRENQAHMDQLKDLGINTIDLVVVNLYPFKETILKKDVVLSDAIENIDIGGPTMIRAGAKNYKYVSVVVDSKDYPAVLERLKSGLKLDEEFNYDLSVKAFAHTADYDATIARYLKSRSKSDIELDTLTVTYDKVADLRYGENPHQKATLYKEISNSSYSIISAEKLHGKELSYNNINDANSAVEILKEFSEEKSAISVAVKHANPCGVGRGKDVLEAYLNSYEADPVSIFGGIVAVNTEIDQPTAIEMSKIFLEIIIAPSFSQAALDVLKANKNLRLLKLDINSGKFDFDEVDFKKISGGILIQDIDDKTLIDENLKVVTKTQPSPQQLDDMKFAFKVVKHVKSNGIVLVKGNKTIGIGPGQTNRITALELAIKYAGEDVAGSVMASDAFFPFDDCVKLADEYKIGCIIQPGGSIKDKDSVAACDRYNIPMVMTGIRHFKH